MCTLHDFFSSKVKFIYTSTVTRSHSCYGKNYAYASRTSCLLSHPFCLFMFSFSSAICTQLDLIHYPGEYSDFGSFINEYTTLDQCKDGCLADVNCYGLDWTDDGESCNHHFEQSNLDIRYNWNGHSQFVKPPACF